MIVLDASVLIAYLDDGQDTLHVAAQRLLTDVVDEELGANALTLAEVLVVPAREHRLEEIVNLLRDIDVAELSFPSDTAARLARLRATTTLKMPDCCVLLSAETTGGTIASFDDRLTKAAGRRGIPSLSGYS